MAGRSHLGLNLYIICRHQKEILEGLNTNKKGSQLQCQPPTRRTKTPILSMLKVVQKQRAFCTRIASLPGIWVEFFLKNSTFPTSMMFSILAVALEDGFSMSHMHTLGR